MKLTQKNQISSPQNLLEKKTEIAEFSGNSSDVETFQAPDSDKLLA
ncbi:hypothetical protein [Candidatus Endomicrobiellum trichonymphae]|nr:hypothetical protein [Candidatus Endomicrobium trichonymphae]